MSKSSEATLLRLQERYPLWTVSWNRSFPLSSIKNPVMIEGLPGIGNVGKIVVDLLIENLPSKKIAEFFSYELPHTVFVQETNLVALPKLELHHARVGKKDFLFVSGDVQPMTEQSSYQFCDLLLDIFGQWGGKEIITLGGIGLPELPTNPRLFLTGTNAKDVEAFSKGYPLHKNIYGVVGPIIGVSGILTGLAGKRGVKNYCILAETLGHQLHLGLVGARKILAVLSQKYGLKIELSKLDKEIKKFQIHLKNENQLEQMKGKKGGPGDDTTDYIG